VSDSYSLTYFSVVLQEVRAFCRRMWQGSKF